MERCVRRGDGRKEAMLAVDFIRSPTFRWASAVAGVLAMFVIVLFGFIYWKIDHYLIARSDRMIALQIRYLAELPPERRINAIEDHLGEDSRNVQFAGLFDPKGHRLAGNIDQLPEQF